MLAAATDGKHGNVGRYFRRTQENRNNIRDKMSYNISFEKFKRGENYNFYDYHENNFDLNLTFEGVWNENFIEKLNKEIESISISCDEEIDLSFFESKMKYIKEINISCKSIQNANSLSKLEKLENLSITTYKNTVVTFELPASLRSFSVNCYKNYTIKSLPVSLEMLFLDNFNTLQEIENFEELNNLKKIELFNCTFIDLNKILKLDNLIYISLYKCQINYKNDSFENLSIKYINFENVKLENVNWIANLKEIDIIILNNCGEIESLNILENKKTIRGISINGKTKIIDGDFKFLESLNKLKNCSITNQKNYSHKSILNWNWDNFKKDKITCFEQK